MCLYNYKGQRDTYFVFVYRNSLVLYKHKQFGRREARAREIGQGEERDEGEMTKKEMSEERDSKEMREMRETYNIIIARSNSCKL